MDSRFTSAAMASDSLAGPDSFYRAILARDARFDGSLFVGVSSTGIYCRPICRVRTPKQQNCRFFSSAAQAEAAAYRPCLKCRPELAPGHAQAWTVMDASRTLARQAAALLDNWTAVGDSASIAALAGRLGVSERHLRRIFQAEHGVTPLQYLQTRRLLLAKQLLTETRLPITQVALASGFRSLRRFNAIFVERYRLNPGRLRAASAEQLGDSAADVSVQLVYREPFDRAGLLAFFRQRAIPGIEAVGTDSIRRTLRAGALSTTLDARSAAAWVEVRFDTAKPRVQLRFANSLLPHSGMLISAVRRWLDLDARPELIDTALHDLPGDAGLRLPGGLDGFELAVRAILGQQVTVAAARTLATRLVERHGSEIATPWPEIGRCFPQPVDLAGLPIAAIAELGIIRSRAKAIIAVAAAWPELGVAMTAGASPQRLIDALCNLPGLGPWTAHYIAMRVLGWPDAFPPGDVAVLKALRLLQAGDLPQATPAQARLAAEQQAQRWQPWRSYAVLRLWNSLLTQ